MDRGGPLAGAAPADVGLAVVEEVGEHETLRVRGSDGEDAGTLRRHDGRIAGDLEPGAADRRGRSGAGEHRPAGLDDERARTERLGKPAERGEREEQERQSIRRRERSGELGAETRGAPAVSFARDQEWKGPVAGGGEHDRRSPAGVAELARARDAERLQRAQTGEHRMIAVPIDHDRVLAPAGARTDVVARGRRHVERVDRERQARGHEAVEERHPAARGRRRFVALARRHLDAAPRERSGDPGKRVGERARVGHEQEVEGGGGSDQGGGDVVDGERVVDDEAELERAAWGGRVSRTCSVAAARS